MTALASLDQSAARLKEFFDGIPETLASSEANGGCEQIVGNWETDSIRVGHETRESAEATSLIGICMVAAEVYAPGRLTFISQPSYDSQDLSK